jgi:hypothetical protein
MTTTRGSVHYTGLLPVSVRLTTLENERFPSGQPSLRKRASRALSSLVVFCAGVTATLAWWSYGDVTREMIANSYPQLGWLTPKNAATVQKAPDRIAPAASDAPDRRQLHAMLDDDLHAIRLSLDRIVAGQELITRSIDEIATSIAARQEQMTRSADQTPATIATGQDQMTRSTDGTASSTAQAPATNATRITVGRAGGAALQPALRVDIKPSETGLAQTSSERGKQLAAASGHDASCFPSASAVLQNNPGASPTWTLRAPGHEGTQCWRAAARPNGSDHRPRPGGPNQGKRPSKGETKTDGTTENALSAPPARYAMPPQ